MMNKHCLYQFPAFAGRYIVRITEILVPNLQLDDVVCDGGPSVGLRHGPGEVAMVRPPVQDVGAPGLARLVYILVYRYTRSILYGQEVLTHFMQ